MRHVRDGLIDTEWQGYYDRHNELGDAGIKGTFITGFGQSLELLAAYPSRVLHSFEAYEAPNEADKSGDPQWVFKLRQAIFRLADLRGISSVAHYPILGPSLTSESLLRDGRRPERLLRPGQHPQLPGRAPSRYAGMGRRRLRQHRLEPAADPPLQRRQADHHDRDRLPGRARDRRQRPQEVVGRYLPRLLVEQYRMGVHRTFLYELCDFPNSGNYGLLHADGAPKPAFNAVKSLLNLLADPGPPIDAAAAGLRGRGERPPCGTSPSRNAMAPISSRCGSRSRATTCRSGSTRRWPDRRCR